MSTADPFTDHCFAFEARGHLGPFQFPLPSNQVNTVTMPNIIYPNPQPIPPIHGVTDMRLLPMMPYDYTPHPPPYFFHSPPQMPFSPQSAVHLSHGGLPANTTSAMDMANNFATQVRI